VVSERTLATISNPELEDSMEAEEEKPMAKDKVEEVN